MKLLDVPLSKKEKDLELDFLNGNISRIMVSKDPIEIIASLGFAVDRLNMLAYSRIRELEDKS